MATTQLSTRPVAYELPSYSLTGDLLGYLRCGLQYRYTRLGKMPSRNPVQLWFGNFIHGVMDEGFRTYKAKRASGASHLKAIAAIDPEAVIQIIEQRLAAQGLVAWEPWVQTIGYARAHVALTELGPVLFPLIHRSEVRLTGARELPQIDPKLRFREAERYEIVGIIDVVTDIELNKPEVAQNQVVQAVGKVLGNLPDHFEVIIDYKGSRRPPVPKPGKPGAYPSLWDQYEWQLLTYADLRARQPDAKPVKAGLLIYVNELLPIATDLETLIHEVSGKPTTDVVAKPADLKEWRKEARSQAHEARQVLQEHPDQEDNLAELAAAIELHKSPVPWELRLARALRVIPVDLPRIDGALKAFDNVVKQIETCRGRECQGKQIVAAWDRNTSDESTCAACDARTWCPDFKKEQMPRLPGIKQGD